VHFHCCVIDGVFALGRDGQIHFAEAAALSAAEIVALQQQVRARVLCWFARAGLLDQADAGAMAGWDDGRGFSLDASVRIAGSDRDDLAPAVLWCPPPFALEPLAHDQLVYRFPRPQPDGTTQLRLGRPCGRTDPAAHRHR
jgi:hypothetical protein